MVSGPVSLDDVYENNLGMLAKLVNTNYPNVYQEEFFSELFAKKSTFFTKLAYFNSVPVGTIKCKLHTKKKSDTVLKGLQIEVLTVLKNYLRVDQIREKLLNWAEEECTKHHQHNIYVHVLSENNAEIEWYTTNGFEQEVDAFTRESQIQCTLLKKHLP
ncbi:hypothetical protein KAFR_0A03960 [Kazachstania africana CBS 2517]|uniref:N-acetyltransferase domain-containing protein n=1 Tax=Kazachstania africana (strain ATCC 22294 / BCRC 22015 / CBS 2517 / CECT 1963 / NBRC 1671 / NRRL Y-8276) TaxID=1071382 RepID=H2AN81_KAZAF|nr:hypothetical protein KAFR_0A03960 [Kazachstania africana CBS 2517]CCF55831.1 hypothetical protein KAFR_0A03960 [Kazachstania africana CBS 2517]